MVLLVMVCDVEIGDEVGVWGCWNEGNGLGYINERNQEGEKNEIWIRPISSKED